MSYTDPDDLFAWDSLKDTFWVFITLLLVNLLAFAGVVVVSAFLIKWVFGL